MMEHPIDWLSAYIDDEIDVENRQLIEAHLEQCESCITTLNELVEIKAQVAGLFERIEPPFDLEQKVMQAIEDKSPVQLWLRSWLSISIISVVCLATFWYFLGPILLKLITVMYKISLATVYLFSNVVTSIPSVYGIVVMIIIMLLMISCISLRRLLRYSTH
jgi:predicted anti-sigma-YlaC factor YlaD